MKLLRYGQAGQEKPGLLDDSGHIRSLCDHIFDFSPTSLQQPKLIETLLSLDVTSLPLVEKTVRIGPCIHTPGKLLCVGFNSKRHAEQMGTTSIPGKDMLVFLKPSSAICGPFDPIYYAKHMKKLDWEAELGIIIGKRGKYIPKENAKDHILGYTCINDLSERYLQLETKDHQFTKGKGFDNAAPIGPYWVTKDEVPNTNNLRIQLWVNTQLRQDFNTGDYIHNDEAVVSYLSHYFTLYPGDIISMGSGPGSAAAWGDDCFLKPNDTVVLSIAGLGQQEQTVVLEPLG